MAVNSKNLYLEDAIAQEFQHQLVNLFRITQPVDYLAIITHHSKTIYTRFFFVLFGLVWRWGRSEQYLLFHLERFTRKHIPLWDELYGSGMASFHVSLVRFWNV